MNVKHNLAGNTVALRPLRQDEKSKGGIFLPDTAIKKLQEGIVEEVGPGFMLADGRVVPIHWQVGQRVVHRKYSGSDVNIGGQEFLYIDARDILSAPEVDQAEGVPVDAGTSTLVVGGRDSGFEG
jgi:chaperonin GroES